MEGFPQNYATTAEAVMGDTNNQALLQDQLPEREESLYRFGELLWLQHAVGQLVHGIRLTHTEQRYCQEIVGT